MTQVVRSEQPWALRQNPFGILRRILDSKNAWKKRQQAGALHTLREVAGRRRFLSLAISWRSPGNPRGILRRCTGDSPSGQEGTAPGPGLHVKWIVAPEADALPRRFLAPFALFAADNTLINSQ